MLNQPLKDRIVDGVLPRVQTPGQYIGGELNAVVRDHRTVRGKLCLAFPDAYTIGMSCPGLQVLYDVMARREDWACERVFTPMDDMETVLREQELPLFSLETFTPLGDFDVLGFSLQHDLCYTNVLTMLDLGGIPLAAEDRGSEHPLIIAGGPAAANPEPVARFIDLFVIGDGEEMLPRVCDAWLVAKDSTGDRGARLLQLAALPHVYIPRFYEATRDPAGHPATPRPTLDTVPEVIEPAVIDDLDAVPLPVKPVVPYIECVQDRIAVEIMRGCPGRCRFCQSTATKRPLRFRKVETIVEAALETYYNTGLNEISLLSLSSSDYPDFDELLTRLHDTFQPLGVSISLPSLRINEQWRTLANMLNTDRHSSLTLAPEVARDDMRRQIGKRITNDDLYQGCRNAFANGFSRVKLYFMCGLPGEREEDLDGIIDMAETISRLGKEIRGRQTIVVANVSNFVPKPQTPYQFNTMQTAEYLQWAREYLYQRKRIRSVQLRCHNIESSMLEGLLSRGDRRMGEVIERAWRVGARFDAWSEKFRQDLWKEAVANAGIDVDRILHQPFPIDARLPWDHIAVRQGRQYLVSEQQKSVAQLAEMGE